MKLTEFEKITEKKIKNSLEIEREERAIAFRKLINEFNEYERQLELEEEREREENEEDWLWLDPADKKVKKVKKVDCAGGIASLIASRELRKEFL